MEKLKTWATAVASKVGVLSHWAVVMCVAYMALALAVTANLKKGVPGPQGPAGIQGPAGPQGPQGKAAKQVVLPK